MPVRYSSPQLGQSRRGKSVLLIVILSLLSAAAAADVRIFLNAPLAQWVSAYSAAARLPQLGLRGPEIRIWTADVMEGYLTGFIISRAGITRCTTSYQESHGATFTVKPATCKPMRERRVALRALLLLKSLAKFNGQELDCGWQDGDMVSVEGTNAAKTFVFAASNPPQCKDPGSRLVTRLLMIIDPESTP